MTISLCMICGNEESNIVACLDSARVAFDELCLVRAIGSNAADSTEQLARQWCADNGKTFKFQSYLNRVPFPHVDNFAEARNLSFALSGSDWNLWLDCDDRLDAMNCLRIREAVEVTSADAIFCAYRIADKGAVIMRERLIRRGCSRWVNAIHEACEVYGDAVECPQIVVYHNDPRDKVNASSARNLSILEFVTDNIERHLFYKHSELMQLQRHDEALKVGLQALAIMPDSMVEERYFVLLNLGLLDEARGEAHLMEAARIQPHRREAFADLCQRALKEGRLSDATSWFRIMDSLPLPSPLPWTHRGMWHGWARNALRVRILKASGGEWEKDHARYMEDEEYRAHFEHPEEVVA